MNNVAIPELEPFIDVLNENNVVHSFDCKNSQLSIELPNGDVFAPQLINRINGCAEGLTGNEIPLVKRGNNYDRTYDISIDVNTLVQDFSDEAMMELASLIVENKEVIQAFDRNVVSEKLTQTFGVQVFPPAAGCFEPEWNKHNFYVDTAVNAKAAKRLPEKVNQCLKEQGVTGIEAFLVLDFASRGYNLSFIFDHFNHAAVLDSLEGKSVDLSGALTKAVDLAVVAQKQAVKPLDRVKRPIKSALNIG